TAHLHAKRVRRRLGKPHRDARAVRPPSGELRGAEARIQPVGLPRRDRVAEPAVEITLRPAREMQDVPVGRLSVAHVPLDLPPLRAVEDPALEVAGLGPGAQRLDRPALRAALEAAVSLDREPAPVDRPYEVAPPALASHAMRHELSLARYI